MINFQLKQELPTYLVRKNLPQIKMIKKLNEFFRDKIFTTDN